MNAEASAWTDDVLDMIFNVVHSRIANNLGECTLINEGVPLGPAKPFRFCVRCHPNKAGRLWEFVHEDSIKKEWDFQFDGERRRLHSATEMKCLWHLVHFLNLIQSF